MTIETRTQIEVLALYLLHNASVSEGQMLHLYPINAIFYNLAQGMKWFVSKV